DRGEDDAHLLRDVDVALNPTEGDEPAAGADTGEEERPLNSASEDEAEEEEESQAFSEDFTQFAQGSPRESQQGSSTARGAIITPMGNFDASLESEIWSEDEDASASQDAAPDGDIEGAALLLTGVELRLMKLTDANKSLLFLLTPRCPRTLLGLVR
ncbi:hypothetical protein PF005_g33623, partial [Phytophthora fragariae]